MSWGEATVLQSEGSFKKALDRQMLARRKHGNAISYKHSQANQRAALSGRNLSQENLLGCHNASRSHLTKLARVFLKEFLCHSSETLQQSGAPACVAVAMIPIGETENGALGPRFTGGCRRCFLYSTIRAGARGVDAQPVSTFDLGDCATASSRALAQELSNQYLKLLGPKIPLAHALADYPTFGLSLLNKKFWRLPLLSLQSARIISVSLQVMLAMIFDLLDLLQMCFKLHSFYRQFFDHLINFRSLISAKFAALLLPWITSVCEIS